MNRKQFLINEIANLVLSRLNEAPESQQDKFRALKALREFIPTLDSKFDNLYSTGMNKFEPLIRGMTEYGGSVYSELDAVLESIFKSLSEISGSIRFFLEPFKPSNELGYGPLPYGYPKSFFRHNDLFGTFSSTIVDLDEEFRNQLSNILERTLLQVNRSSNSEAEIDDAFAKFESDFQSLINSTEQRYKNFCERTLNRLERIAIDRPNRF